MDAHTRLYWGYEVWMLITGYTEGYEVWMLIPGYTEGYEVWMLITGYTGDMRYGCSYQVILWI